MANRFPLIFNSGAGQIQELAASDNLDLTSSNLVNAGILSTSSGSVTAPSLQIGSGTTYNPGLYSPGTDQLAVATNGVQRINIEADGDINIDGGGVFYDATNNRLAIGTTSPSVPLHVLTSTTNTPGLFEHSGSVDSYLYLKNSTGGAYVASRTNDLSFHTAAAATERARIDSSGRLLVGTASARANLYNSTFTSLFQVEGTSYNTTGGLFVCNINDETTCSVLNLVKSRGTTVGSNTLVSSGDTVGALSFSGNDGTEFVQTALIKAEIDGTPGANDMPGRLVFSTTPDGGGSPTSSPPAMTIKSSQEVLIGTSTITANGGVLQLKSGITFPATAVAASDANTLDDYEEGTWTPQAQDQSGNQFPGYTGTPSGKYTKIGQLVHVSISLRTNGLTTGMNTGEQLKITGLPFTPSSASVSYVHCAAGLTALSPATYFNLLAVVTSTTLDIFSTGGDATSPYTATIFTVANFESGSGAFIHANFSYPVS